MLIRLDCAVIVSLPVVHSSLKPFPCAFSGGSAVLCAPGALHTRLAAACLVAKCVCAEGAVPWICVCWRSTPLLMMVVTLQVPWVMSHLEEIINQVND